MKQIWETRSPSSISEHLQQIKGFTADIHWIFKSSLNFKTSPQESPHSHAASSVWQPTNRASTQYSQSRHPSSKYGLDLHKKIWRRQEKCLHTSCLHISIPSCSLCFIASLFLFDVLFLFCLGQGLWKLEHLLSHQNRALCCQPACFSPALCLSVLFSSAFQTQTIFLQGGEHNENTLTLRRKDCSIPLSSFVWIKFNSAQFNINLDRVYFQTLS